MPASLADKTITAIAAGGVQSLALDSDGHVTAWGYNRDGNTTVPASLADKTITAIAAGGGQSLALDSDGHVTAWGTNDAGQATVPASLADKTITAIAAGQGQSLALDIDGHLTAWGYNNFGQATVPSSLADKTIVAISAGENFDLALTSDGQVVAWGENDQGQTNVPNMSGRTITAISAGGYHALALTSDGKVIAWGADQYHECEPPTSLTGKTVTAISGGDANSVALTSDGHIVAWGFNDEGENEPPAYLDGARVTSIEAGSYHALATYFGVFTSGPDATIQGTPQVGQQLVASTGSPDPTPDSYSYEWLAGGTLIQGATGATFTPTFRELGDSITVRVSAQRANYDTATSTSPPTDPVTTNLPSTTLRVTTPGGFHLAGTRLLTTTRGLEPGEPYTIEVGGIEVATGSAATSQLLRSITVPPTLREGTTRISVTGSGPFRKGTQALRIVRAKALPIHFSRPVTHKRTFQHVTIGGLATGEPVLITYRGKRITPAAARANANGRYHVAIRVGRLAGIKTVTATGAFPRRHGVRTFIVKRH